VELLIALGDVPGLVDPQEGVLDPMAIRVITGLMNPHGNR
jgi:hypothetical protein